MRLVKMILLSVSLLAIAFSQTERWVYRYNGLANYMDWANGLVYGEDGNIFAAGGSYISFHFAMAVISLTSAGSERWVYLYDGPGHWYSRAYSIIYGADNYIYAAGFSEGIGTYSDFTVISLKEDGSERWAYLYNGPGNDYRDAAFSLFYGGDNNIYAVGRSTGNGTYDDFTVISLTSTGGERWVYRYNGQGNGEDCAYSIVYGTDGNIYAAGWSYDSLTDFDFLVISLTRDGSERWVYRHDGPESRDDKVYSIIYGNDGNIYVAGSEFSQGGVSYYDFVVISLTPDGIERWVYRNDLDAAYSLVYGVDENIYACGGFSWGVGDLIIISLTSTGEERWVYRYNGPANREDYANSIIYGLDENIYAVGISRNISTDYDFTVISLTTIGEERWVYQYNGSANSWDKAYSLVYGDDGNVYIAGLSKDNNTDLDFIVISLNPAVGIEENNLNHYQQTTFRISLSTYQNKNLTYTISLPEPTDVSLTLYNLQGQKVESWQVTSPEKTTHYVKYLTNLNPGVYFLKAEVLGKGYKVNKRLIVIK